MAVSTGRPITPEDVNVRIASGTASVNTVANTIVSVAVDFPAGRFTKAPAVVANAWSGVPGQVIEITVSNVTATGCTLYAYRTTALANMGIMWLAHQDEV